MVDTIVNLKQTLKGAAYSAAQIAQISRGRGGQEVRLSVLEANYAKLKKEAKKARKHDRVTAYEAEWQVIKDYESKLAQKVIRKERTVTATVDLAKKNVVIGHKGAIHK